VAACVEWEKGGTPKSIMGEEGKGENGSRRLSPSWDRGMVSPLTNEIVFCARGGRKKKSAGHPDIKKGGSIWPLSEVTVARKGGSVQIDVGGCGTNSVRVGNGREREKKKKKGGEGEGRI